MNIPLDPHVAVNLTQTDLATIAQAFDIAIKATGLEGAKKVLPVLAKIENAIAAQSALQKAGEA